MNRRERQNLGSARSSDPPPVATPIRVAVAEPLPGAVTVTLHVNGVASSPIPPLARIVRHRRGLPGLGRPFSCVTAVRLVEMRLFRRRSQTPAPAAPTISVGDLRRRLERGEDVLVLDVRQPAAYAEYPGAIPGSVRIPPATIPDRYHELPRDRLIVLYCT